MEAQFQHYVPQFYLRAWDAQIPNRPCRVWLYVKGTRPRLPAIRKAARRENLYAITDADGNVDLHSVEQYLGVLEGKAGKIFTKIFQREMISNQDKADLALFISAMYRRDPYTFDRFVPDRTKSMISSLRDELLAPIGQIEDIDHKQRYEEMVERTLGRAEREMSSITARAILESGRMALSVFAKMQFSFLYSKSVAFVTSDTPLVFDRFRGIQRYENAHLVFPVSQQVVLWLTSWPAGDRTYVEIPRSTVEQINLSIISNAHKEVFAGYESEHLAEVVDRLIGTRLPPAPEEVDN